MENKMTPKQALEQLKDTKPCEFVCIGSQCQEEIEIIEQALTDYENLKEVVNLIILRNANIKDIKRAIIAEKENGNLELFPAVGFYNRGQRDVENCFTDSEFELIRKVFENGNK